MALVQIPDQPLYLRRDTVLMPATGCCEGPQPREGRSQTPEPPSFPVIMDRKHWRASPVGAKTRRSMASYRRAACVAIGTLPTK
jgi:hypothetical protein